MKNIEVLNNKFKRLCFMDNAAPGALHYFSDKLTTTLSAGVYTLEFKVNKDNSKSQFLKEGNYITFLNNQGVRLFMFIYGVDDYGGKEKTVYCEDTALILVNSFADPIQAPKAPQTLGYYLELLLKDTGFSIGKNESVGTQTLEFLGIDESILSRVRSVLEAFGMQFYMSADMTADGPKFFVNIVKNRLEGDYGFRLSTDDVINQIERKVNIRNVITRLTVRGAAIESSDKKNNVAGTSNVAVPAQQSVVSVRDSKVAKLIQWFVDRRGKVSYSMQQRTGPNSYDCSSAVYYALLFAGFITSASWPYTTETLYSLEGKLLKTISYSEVQPGDIFVAGRKGASAGSFGHTGVYYGDGKIIHCNGTDGGISITPVAGRTGSPVYWYRLIG